MKKLIFLFLLLGGVAYGQSGTTVIGGSGSGTLSKIDSTVTFTNIPIDPMPDTVLTLSGTKVKKITTSQVPLGFNVGAYGSGTLYKLTNTAALIDFGTVDPSIVLTEAGTYLILAGANFRCDTATFAANQTITVKIRRTNNTAADVANALDALTLPIITTTTLHGGTSKIPCTTYTTSNTNDILQIWGSVSATPSAGYVRCTQAHIMALKLY